MGQGQQQQQLALELIAGSPPCTALPSAMQAWSSSPRAGQGFNPRAGQGFRPRKVLRGRAAQGCDSWDAAPVFLLGNPCSGWAWGGGQEKEPYTYTGSRRKRQGRARAGAEHLGASCAPPGRQHPSCAGALRLQQRPQVSSRCPQVSLQGTGKPQDQPRVPWEGLGSAPGLQRGCEMWEPPAPAAHRIS